jgi:4-amino-4-deoxy-L-arabinose transferase-like glycosyltransferase
MNDGQSKSWRIVFENARKRIRGEIQGKTSNRVLYVLLFATGFILRFGFTLYQRTYVWPQGEEVMSIAAHLARGQGFSSPFYQDTGPTTWVAPLYPMIVSIVYKLFGNFSAVSSLVVIGLQCAMAGVTGVAIHALGKRTFGQREALWAASIWTVSPFFFRWATSWIWDFSASALVLTVTLAIGLEVAEKGSKKLWLWLGGLWGVAGLTNPALLSVMPFTMAYAGFTNRRARRNWAGGMTLAIALFAAVIAPWLIRNRIVFGHPVFVRGNYWFEFSVGNFHYSNGMGYLGKHPEGNPAELNKYVRLGEQGYFQESKKKALQFLSEYPTEFKSLTLHRIWWFWDGTPVLYNPREWWQPWELWPLSCGGWLGLLFVLTRRVRGWIIYAACLIAYPIPYYLTFAPPKYRHAIEPELLLLSVYLVRVLWDEVRLMAGHREQRISSQWHADPQGQIASSRRGP